MADLDYPASPVLGQVFDQWTWNGTYWELTGSGGGGDAVNNPWKPPVVTTTTGPITLSGLQSIDQVTVKEGDRVLVKDQHWGDVWDGPKNEANGIYIASAGAWTRAPDALTPASLVGAIVRVIGTTASPSSPAGGYTDTLWLCSRPRPHSSDTWINFVPAAGPVPDVISGVPSSVLVSINDHGTWYDINGGSATVITLPDPAGLPMGFEVTFVRNTTYAVTFTPAVAGTITSAGGMLAIANQGGVVSAKRIGFYTPMWVLSGDLGETSLPFMKIGLSPSGPITKSTTWSGVPFVPWYSGALTDGFLTNAPEYFQYIDSSRIRIEPGRYGIELSWSVRYNGATKAMPWGKYGTFDIRNVAPGGAIPGGGTVIMAPFHMSGSYQSFSLFIMFAVSTPKELYATIYENDTANAAETWGFDSRGNNIRIIRYEDM